MNDQPRQILIQLIQQHGPALADDPRRVRSFLADLCGQHHLEINLLMQVLNEDLARDLRQLPAGLSPDAQVARLTNILRQRTGLEADKARWAVVSWAAAFGLEVDAAGLADTLPQRMPEAAAAETVPPVAPIGPERERPRADDLRLQLAPHLALELVRIPAGAFLMGSDPIRDPDAGDDEQPQHTVTLPEYLISKTPVTVAQFAAFVKATGQGANAGDVLRDLGRFGAHPVSNVSWRDAQAFCAWASRVSGRTVALPSEAEWEKAARGPDGRLYPWGDQAPDERRCNFNMRVKDTSPVGQYSPHGDSPYGLVDMAGNVWEWTRSCWRPYPYRAHDGREDLAASGARVLRGGSFDYAASVIRCAKRFSDQPNQRGYRGGDRGFRVVAA